ncbi:tyrosine-type recombinase/integrase [Botrimarina mediterranea]|uniref:Site-specific tyrosine recombinase XerC n=1 Tax=Botrimarina mediterranea TaxID=2528022 RepID=A0A518K3W8_9BACT|nr:site-specific integrase [Botrimarina mediterranea]QDV72480.1 site-specific tyrosine recombinase XerC [Botrimarina mediterranea]
MPTLSKSLPKYRKHRASGQAVVTIAGVDHYLGPHRSVTSRREYDRLVAEWLARGRQPAPSAETGPKVVEVLAAYWRFAKSYYPTPGGKLGGELWSIRGALRFVRELYADRPAEEFGPLALKVVRERMVDAGFARSTVNQNVGRIRRAFRWAASEQLIPATVSQALATVDGLRTGKTAARDPEPIRPVEDAAVEATLPNVSPVVAAMIRLQRLTGMRPGEVCLVRPCDVDRTGDVWHYRPATHKTQHRGRERVVFLGPQAQEILRPFLLREATAYCFSPAESESRRRADLHAERKTPLSSGNRPGTNRRRKPARSVGDKYTTTSYARAIARGCELTWPAPEGTEGAALRAWNSEYRWTPNQLRHTAATAIRREFGLEAAQIALGHAGADVTQVYAERDLAKGAEVARRIG